MPNRNKNLIGDCANAARGRETRSRNMPCCMSRESNQSRDLGRRSLAVHPRLSTPDHKCSSNFRAEIRNTAQTAGTAAGQDGIGRRSRLDDGMADGLTDEEKQTPISSYYEERLSVLSIPDHNPDRILGTPFPLRLPESHYQNCWTARRDAARPEREAPEPQTISRRCTS